MIRFSRLAALLLILSLVSGALVGPAAAQEGIEVENSSSMNETDSSGSGDGDGGIMPSLPSIDDFFSWIHDKAAGIYVGVLEGSAQVLIGTPTPDNAGWNGIFGQPTEEPYSTLYEPIYESQIFPFALGILSICIMLIGGFLPYSSLVGSYRVYMWLLRLFVAVFALIFAWPLASWMHQLSNDIAWAFAPEALDMATLEGSLTLGSTAAPVAASLYLFGWAKIVLYTFIYFFRYQLLFWMPFAFPVMLILALAAPHSRLRRFGSFGIWQYVGLLIMTWPNAVMFGAAYQLEWSFGFSAFANVGLVMGMFLTGILVPIGIMYGMAQGPGLVTGAMMGAASSTAQGVRRRSREGWQPDTSPRSVISSVRDAPGRARERTRTTYERTTERLSSARSSVPSPREGYVPRVHESDSRSRSRSLEGANNQTGPATSHSKTIKEDYGSESTDRKPPRKRGTHDDD